LSGGKFVPFSIDVALGRVDLNALWRAKQEPDALFTCWKWLR
jgi:hypothetical protein